MDELLAAIGKLFGVFKDPLTVFMLLVMFGLAFALYKVVKFIMDRYDADIRSRADLASAIQGFSKQLGAIEENGK